MSDSTAMSDNPNYFDMDYKLWPIWLGLDWVVLSFTPMIAYYAVRPWYRNVCVGGTCQSYWWGLTPGENFAWGTLMYGMGPAFWVLTVFWLLSYIKLENRTIQKIYYRAIAWIIPITWLLAFMMLIAFIVGGTQGWTTLLGNYGTGWIGLDIGVAIGFLIWIGGLEALAWWFAGEGVVKYYRWEEQAWWNYTTEGAPDNWPDQLGFDDEW